MRNLGGAIGIAACATILNDRTNLHFTRLGRASEHSNEAMNQWLSHRRRQPRHPWPERRHRQSTPACGSLWLLTYREAQTQTYSDTFLMIMRVLRHRHGDGAA
jgi:DHA2 family multidrug resistance protein